MAKAYHILGMPLNAFLQAMAQRAGTNYIPTPEVQGMVNSIFYDVDPLSMAKAGARANGYKLESLDGVFIVHRVLPAAEGQPPLGAFRQKKSSATPLVSPHPAPSRPMKQSGAAVQEKSTSLRISKHQAAAGRNDVRPPKKLPVAQKPDARTEDKKLIALTKKLALQKEERKELLEQERQLHRRLREEERALEAQRKATEKALREHLVRSKKAAEGRQMQRQQAVE